MALERLTEQTVENITRSMGGKLSEEDAAALSVIVRKALVEAVEHVSHKYGEVAVSAVGADADKAHKLAEALEKVQVAIIANLQGLR